MKLNHENVSRKRRAGLPPLPADAIYRRQLQFGAILEDFGDDQLLGSSKGNGFPSPIDIAEPMPELKAGADDQVGSNAKRP